METIQNNLYFDPFAENGEELFDPLKAFEQVKLQYEQNKVDHDFTADKFVSQTEALMMDAMFIERFDAVQAIVSQMHRMCGEDHNLRSQLQTNPLFKEHSSNDGHGHDKIENHDHEDDDDEDDEYVWVSGRLVKRKKRSK